MTIYQKWTPKNHYFFKFGYFYELKHIFKSDGFANIEQLLSYEEYFEKNDLKLNKSLKTLRGLYLIEKRMKR